MDASTFYLGCSNPHWLHQRVPVPLFIALHHLDQYLRNENWQMIPAAPWALDSGAYSHIRTHGRWTMTAEDYADRVWSHANHMPWMQWAAPRDLTCDSGSLAKTGLGVVDHQKITVANFLDDCAAWERLVDESSWIRMLRSCGEETPEDRPRCPFVPVLQGGSGDDWLRCADLYAAAGVDLWAYPVVGLGSIAGQQATTTAARVVERLALGLPGLPLHGFGVAVEGLRAYGDLLASADSHTWSAVGRRAKAPCRHGLVKWETNCPLYAMEWRQRAIASLPGPGEARTARALQAALW